MQNSMELYQQLVESIRAECMEELLGRMTGSVAPAKQKSKTKPGPKPGTKAKTPRTAGDLEKLIASIKGYVSKHPGSRTEEISAGLALPTARLQLPMKKMIAGKIMTKKGERRAARYTVK